MNASRSDPADWRAIQCRASSSIDAPSSAAASRRQAAIRSWPIRLNAKCWQRERTVAGTLCGSVVANTKVTYGGGSSIVFSSALNADVDSMCTSSMM